ncbi:hypothetical protein M422DRAFT_261598 [Sphaerobolus stellatus SS14]|uniref:Uncharacterized protein n=1 Tax=Sphaerobolus stellatus (strain SS14) TaxID=990650 RepID=A0A0C9VEL2_SPHS4|nr:hypothetical protein M422DRAFT_261598 [Sphaerobolus stellatus SS14]
MPPALDDLNIRQGRLRTRHIRALIHPNSRGEPPQRTRKSRCSFTRCDLTCSRSLRHDPSPPHPRILLVEYLSVPSLVDRKICMSFASAVSVHYIVSTPSDASLRTAPACCVIACLSISQMGSRWGIRRSPSTPEAMHCGNVHRPLTIISSFSFGRPGLQPACGLASEDLQLTLEQLPLNIGQHTRTNAHPESGRCLRSDSAADVAFGDRTPPAPYDPLAA